MPYNFSILQIKTFQVDNLEDADDPSKWNEPSNVLTDSTRASTPEGAAEHSYALKNAIYGLLQDPANAATLTAAAMKK